MLPQLKAIHSQTLYRPEAGKAGAYANLQLILGKPQWQGKFTARDYAALTPLIWEHVNPYGRFALDMNSRLALL